MKLSPTFLRCACAALLLFGGAATVFAVALPVQNYSFEEPVLPDGQYTGYNNPATAQFERLPGWENASPGLTGIQHFNDTHYSYVPDGVNGCYTDSNNWIAQTLQDFVIQPGTYTLTIDIGWRLGRDPTGGEFGLFVVNGDSFDLLGNSGVTNPSVQGNWLTNTLVVEILPDNPAIGKPLRIQFHGQHGHANDFDNVRLDFSASIPEPGTWAVLLGGLALLRLATRRKS